MGKRRNKKRIFLEGRLPKLGRQRKNWQINDHAVSRFYERFLAKNGQPLSKEEQQRYIREHLKELRRLTHKLLMKSELFAVKKGKQKPSVIYLWKSSVFGNVYFITNENIVYTVFPEKFAQNKLRKGIWRKV